MDLESLRVDPRRRLKEPYTGICVRATHDGKWGNYDIAELDDESFAFFVNQHLSEDGRWHLILILLGRPVEF